MPDLDREYRGAAKIESYTVFFRSDGSPRAGVVVALTPEGKRTLARVPEEDAHGLEKLMDPDLHLVGTAGIVEAGEIAPDGQSILNKWTSLGGAVAYPVSS